MATWLKGCPERLRLLARTADKGDASQGDDCRPKAIEVSRVQRFVPQSKLYVNSFCESGHIEPLYGIQRFFKSDILAVCNDV
jgi:hypothetical protein